MTLKLNGTNSVAAPAYAGDDADTGLQCGTNELKLVTGGTARATVDSSGNLGINTTSPRGLVHLHSSSAPRLDFTNTTTGTGSGDGATISVDGSTGALNIIQRESQPIQFYTGNTERLRLLSGGGLTFNGDTAAANALDDYEEGTWTPTLSWGGTSATLSGGTYGYYTKIGNTVQIQFRIQQTARNTPSGSALMGGLPFTEGAATYNHGMVQGDSGISMPAGAGSIMLYINSNTSRFLYQGNTGHADFLSAHCADATSFYGFAIYNV